MQFISLNQTNHDYWQTIYREAFPPNERIAFQELKQKAADNHQIKMVCSEVNKLDYFYSVN